MPFWVGDRSLITMLWICNSKCLNSVIPTERGTSDEESPVGTMQPSGTRITHCRSSRHSLMLMKVVHKFKLFFHIFSDSLLPHLEFSSTNSLSVRIFFIWSYFSSSLYWVFTYLDKGVIYPIELWSLWVL